ncbi:MAG: RDD family protein [Nostocaceae cyanobacterium]|nr:RDD family protein [Nostocaceae cyanobacterium]
MTIERIPPQEYPQVGIGRRCLAFGIDFLGVWLVSSLLGSNNLGIQFVQILVFIVGWLILRVIVPYNNQGQSLGRWTFDIKLLEAEWARIPDLQSFLKREMIVGLEALLISIAISNIIRNPTAILLILPLVIDCGAALSDTRMRQAFHDRYARTMIVSSRRGYSLDIKFKRLVEMLRRNMR